MKRNAILPVLLMWAAATIAWVLAALSPQLPDTTTGFAGALTAALTLALILCARSFRRLAAAWRRFEAEALKEW